MLNLYEEILEVLIPNQVCKYKATLWFNRIKIARNVHFN